MNYTKALSKVSLKHFLLLSMLKTENKQKTEIFCNIINRFTVTFDQFNASLKVIASFFIKRKSYI